MALFDASMFAPQTYDGGMGGLLGQILKMVQAQPQPSQGFPGAQNGQTYAQGNQGAMGGVPFPIMGDPSALPLNAQPTQGVMPQQALPPQAMPQQQPMPQQAPQQQSQQPQQSLFSLPPIQSAVGNLQARTSPGWAQLQMQQRQVQQQMEAMNATYHALRASDPNMPDSVAQAAALNPEVMKTVAPNIYSKPTWGVIGQNAMGQNQYGFIDTVHGKVTSPNGGQASASGAGQLDPSLTGDELLKAIAADPSLGPGKAAMVKSIADGRTPYPSGFLLKTPFGQWLTTAVGQYEPGLDATLIGQRKMFNQQLGSAAPSSVGGQKSLMGTSLGHLSEVADAATSLANGAGPLPGWVPGSAFGAHVTNSIANSGTDQSAKVKALDDAVQKFSGEVGKLYSGSAGGGIGEREATRSRFSGNLSPQEMAASLEMSKALIQSKLAALENQQDQIFGPNGKGRVDVLGENGRSALAKIDAAIAKLRGQAGSQPSDAATPNQTAPQTAINPKTGQRIMLKGNQWVPMQ